MIWLARSQGKAEAQASEWIRISSALITELCFHSFFPILTVTGEKVTKKHLQSIMLLSPSLLLWSNTGNWGKHSYLPWSASFQVCGCSESWYHSEQFLWWMISLLKLFWRRKTQSQQLGTGGRRKGCSEQKPVQPLKPVPATSPECRRSQRAQGHSSPPQQKAL